ncbi:type I-F CRISPR-associated helicase Cas3f [Teredinibacter sp. KSP-S5-2]|uniref:type I-F CRISPR-associated helicase Cas3f n=1 Tax=Teredinibacter sp. KSP-S5-2 TaxID=3034506 RepID=UPI002934C55E|nr:type I-F CRISPR-associated helicase Cas3f [Teredinibacter sp. KSP-S5-2]WNO08319.1 type I-F CRISPR-associated helicase Cas3f [Teredinibacter sp. KSP-S5-2]
MMVTFVSQCEKNALKKTRRVLDAFANRIGDNTWQTVITEDGLFTVKKMLRKTASKSTAVSCHWIRSRSRSQFLWCVGNKSKFNSEGVVPVNSTEKNLLNSEYENNWLTAEDITLLAGIAALFHDFGKANALFQKKIDPSQKSKLSEPYRHEWVSLVMFIAFVNGEDDQAWLTKLSGIAPAEDKKLQESIKKIVSENPTLVPYRYLMTPVARAVAWLILTHHKLPFYKTTKGTGISFSETQNHIDKKLVAVWNSPQVERDDWSKSDLKSVWEFKRGTPFVSLRWCNKARDIAERALARKHFFQSDSQWLDDKFSLHIARLTLMLADHHYSSLPANTKYQDKSYLAFANSDRKTKLLKQKLDEHLIGVYQHSVKLMRHLPSLKQSLPAVANLRVLEKPTKAKRFLWQNRAYSLAKSVGEQTEKTGFFGVNMASTGHGKTLGNARIMYGLSNPKEGCRFSVALGLRTLTLQTGQALGSRLELPEEDLAVLIGSQAVKMLHDLEQDKQTVVETDIDALKTGSESENELMDQNQSVSYSGALSDSALKDWLAKQPKLNKLVNAPVLVSTVDHLMPATEGSRGGKQIAPMLRLLTSDLVLDEPDDFDIADLPALIRLVNWAGLLGSRVLLSSATLPPAALEALFAAYKEGREHFNRSQNLAQYNKVTCAWFDECSEKTEQLADLHQFEQCHSQFVKSRTLALAKKQQLHKAIISEPIRSSIQPSDIIGAMAEVVRVNLYELHQRHNQTSSEGKKISVGLVRMANINPLVAVAQQLACQPVAENTHIHICVYHSQFPLVQRSNIENTLDAVLDRSESETIWQQPAIINGLHQSKAENHIFIILATSVAEVGRDWDLDWAIAEPSSMRSIIQLAGRIQRHRQTESPHHNLVILSTNYRALKTPGEPAFCKPGFETKEFLLSKHELTEVLTPEQYKIITAIPRIQLREEKDWRNNLVDLEHHHLHQAMFNKAAKVGAWNWWEQPCHLTYQLQSATPFRASSPGVDYYMSIQEGGDASDAQIKRMFDFRGQNQSEAKTAKSEFNQCREPLGQGVSLWANTSYPPLVARLASQLGWGLEEACMVFGAVNLRDSNKPWSYSDEFGFCQALE